MTETAKIQGAYKGYKYRAQFELSNGQVWEQTSPKFKYANKNQPDVVIYATGSRGQLKIDGMDEFVDVKRIR